ncbi:MAG: Gfo/Idh/MocA family protein [Alphaproteobacteria bacterium]
MTEVRIGLIGAGWMGKAHATAYRNVPMVFGNDPATPVLELVADLNPDWAQGLADSFGFKRWTGEWREVVEDSDVDVIDIVTPNNVHAEMAIAAVQAGKHVYCEKPMAPTAADSGRMLAAAEAAGAITLVGYNYLKNPAQGFARQLIEEGEIGDVVLFRGTFDQDFMADPQVPFNWRLERAVAGSGALGDMASHTLSLAQWLVGDVAEVCGMAGTFIAERRVPSGGSGHTVSAQADAPMRAVENDDVAQFLLRFASGAMGTIEASRIGTGRRLWLSYEIQGTRGALFFTQERMNELQLYRLDDPSAERGYKTIYIGPDHPGYAAFHPIAGIGLGYNDQKIIEAREIVAAVAEGRPAHPDFGFGHKVSVTLEAVEKSIAARRWVRLDEVTTG